MYIGVSANKIFVDEYKNLRSQQAYLQPDRPLTADLRCADGTLRLRLHAAVGN